MVIQSSKSGGGCDRHNVFLGNDAELRMANGEWRMDNGESMRDHGDAGGVRVDPDQNEMARWD